MNAFPFGVAIRKGIEELTRPLGDERNRKETPASVGRRMAKTARENIF